MMLTLLNTKLNAVLRSISNNLDRTVNSVNRSNRINHARLNVNDLDAHIVNIWFANTSTAIEERASNDQVWETFTSIANTEHQLCFDRKCVNNQNYVSVYRDIPVPFAVFEFDTDKLSFVDAALVDGSFFQDLRDFNNMIGSRQPYENQGWFASNYPAASNFLEATTLLMRKHNIAPHDFFNFANPETAQMVKQLVSKLQRHGIKRGDFFDLKSETEVAHVDVESEATTPNAMQDAMAIARELNSEFGEGTVKVAVSDEDPEVEIEMEEEIDEVVEEQDDAVDVNAELEQIVATLWKHHALPSRGRDRKQMHRSLTSGIDLTENVELILSFIEALSMSDAERADYEALIEDCIDLIEVATPETETQAADDLIASAEEFEADFETVLEEDDGIEIESGEEDEDEIESIELSDEISIDLDDSPEFESDDTDEVERSSVDFSDGEDETEEQDEEEQDEEEQDEEYSAEVIALVDSNSIATLRRRCRLLKLSVAQSRKLTEYELAEYIASHTA